MGLFQKQECVLCGGKAGLLTRHKLADGSFICGDCRTRLPEHTDDIGELTLDDVNELINIKEENDRRYESEFTVTRQFDYDGRHPVMAVDDNTGEFAILSDSRPDIYSFDQITGYNVDLNTRLLTEEERKRNPTGLIGVLDFFLSEDFGTRFPGLPNCPRGHKVTGMYLEIDLAPNPLHAKRLRIDMMPGWGSNDNDIEKGYLCANSIYQCIREYKSGNTVRSQAPQPAADDSADQIKKFKELLDMGAITQEEFDAKKKQLLGI